MLVGRHGLRFGLLWVAFCCGPVTAMLAVADEASEGLATAGRLRIERNLVFREVSGTRIKADMYRLDDHSTYPLVVMIHGGAWSLGDKWDLTYHAQELARAGFVAVSVNYRLAPSVQIQQQLEDCRCALNWAQAQADKWDADAGIIGLWGYSAGAQLAAMLALQPGSGDPPVKAIVAGGIPSDFSFIPEDARALSYVMGGTRREKPEVYREVAPLEVAHADSPPFFIFHGEHDRVVPQNVSQRFVRRLEQLEVPVQYNVVQGKGHLMTFLDQPARRAAIAFLQERLEPVDLDAAKPSTPEGNAK